MTREELKHSGLLDQYVLGLLGPEQSAEVEELVAQDPELERAVAKLRGDLESYADARNIAPPAGGRAPRTAQEFQDLDHEMITAMMERNHTLNLWRYLLIAACLLLVGLSGYLFRLKEKARGELVTERALHAQDKTAYAQDLRRNRAALEVTAAHWKDLRTYEQPLDTGSVHVHFLAGTGLALVDLSDARVPPAGQAYYVFGEGVGMEPIVVGPEQLEELFPVAVAEAHPRLRVYRWERGRTVGPQTGEAPLAILELGVE